MKCLINQEQKSFIQEFYPSHGSLYCSKRLGLTSKQVVWQAFRLKIKCDENVISKNCSASRRASMPDENSYKVEPTQFFDVVNPKIAYLLGLLWADGWVKKNGRFCVGISTVVDDFKDFEPILKSIGNWNYYDIPKEGNRQTQKRAETHNKALVLHLKSHSYDSKDMSPDSIIDSIPENLRRYWFLGLFDGDGCIFYNRRTMYANVSSCYTQDWNFMEKLFNSLNTHPTITRVIKTNPVGGKSSFIQIHRHSDLLAFYQYLYPNGYEFGLKRKFEKFSSCFQYIKSRPLKSSKYKYVYRMRNLYQAKPIKNGCLYHIGTFRTEEDAHDAVEKFFKA